MSTTKLPEAVTDLFDLHQELCAKALGLMERKNNDYRSGTGDPYKNFRGATTFDVSAVRGILLRMQDKMCRIATFDEKGELLVKDEGVEDAIVDIINYAVLMGGLIREQSKQADHPAPVDIAVGTPAPRRASVDRLLSGTERTYGTIAPERCFAPLAPDPVRGGQCEGGKPRAGARKSKR